MYFKCLGMEYLASQEYDEAIKMFTMFNEQNVENDNFEDAVCVVLANLAYAYFKKGDQKNCFITYDKAIAWCESQKEDKLILANVLTQSASAAKKLGDEERVSRDCSRALKLIQKIQQDQPNDPEAFNLLERIQKIQTFKPDYCQ